MWLHRPHQCPYIWSLVSAPNTSEFVTNISCTGFLESGSYVRPDTYGRHLPRKLTPASAVDMHWKESIRQNWVTRLGVAQEWENKAISPCGSPQSVLGSPFPGRGLAVETPLHGYRTDAPGRTWRSLDMNDPSSPRGHSGSIIQRSYCRTSISARKA